MSRGFLRSTSVVGGLTLLSRISGLVRDMVYSHAFGAGTLMDAFLVAFKIPNFLRRLTAEGAFSQAFVPVISEYKVRRSPEEVRQLVGHVSGTLGIALFALTMVGVIAAPVLVMAFAPGFTGDAERYELTVDMLRLTFAYIFFISLVALSSGILNSYGRFAVPAFTPVLLNVVMIVFAGLVAPNFERPGIALAAGVFVAGLVQLLLQLPALRAIGMLPMPRWGWAHEGVKRIARLMLPGVFGSSVAQVSLLLDTLIASFLVTGSIAWMYYADRLVEFPLGVFTIALATVILPGLSSHHASEDRDQFSSTLDWALRITTVVVTPAAVGLALLAAPLTATIFGYGEFDARDVQMSAYALVAYGAGLIGFSMVKVLAPGYFARQDTRTPVRIGIIALAANLGFNLVVVVPAHLAGFAAPHALLALSTGLSAGLNSLLLYRGLRRSGVYSPSGHWRRLLPQVLGANAAMAAFLWWSAGDWSVWTVMNAPERLLRLAGCVGGGALVYFAALAAFGARPGDFRGARSR
ncbi:MAG: murein biosynthesis protein MurJ [Proteobacteria bacterium]|nr:murein biosynthesis protein MurJ [Pseudomonadota bacterium]